MITLVSNINGTEEKQSILSNQEIREVLKCFGDLNLEEGCVICRYITQKIYKVLDISAMCPDIVETKLLNQREREWKPDPQVINKWTVLYNLQKDYSQRILPQIQAMKGYDDIVHKKILKEKAEKENLANLIQFQNKMNSDLQRNEKKDKSKFDSDKENCDDEDLKYQHNKVISPQKPHITDFNKLLLNQMKQNKSLHEISKDKLDPSNKSTLQNTMKDFFNKKKGYFNFKEKPHKDDEEEEEKIPDSKYLNEEVINIDMNDPSVKSNVDFDKMISSLKLKNGEKVEYLGTSYGSPYSGLNQSKVQDKLEKMSEERGQPIISKAVFINKKTHKKLNHIKHENKNKKEIHHKIITHHDNKHEEKHEIDKKVNAKKEIEKEKIDEKEKEKDIEPTPILIQKSEIKKTNTKVNSKTKIENKPVIKNKFDTNSEPALDESDNSFEQLNKNILNPPNFSSFVESSDVVTLDKSFYDNFSKSNFNLETQRRGRRRSRFPDPQWDCAESQIAKLVRYLCEEEISTSNLKYCKPIFQQINTMIESFLYHDNNLEICQNLHMCPVTVDI